MAPRKSLPKEGTQGKKAGRTPLKTISNSNDLVVSGRVEKTKQKCSSNMTRSRRSSAMNSVAIIQRKSLNPTTAKKIHAELKRYIWIPHRVGILVNFKFTESYLKRYRRYIRNGLGGNKYTVQIELGDPLDGEDESNQCIHICVKNSEAGSRVVYDSWMVGLTSSLEDKLADREVNMPLLFARGNKLIMEKLHSLLEVMFSTTVHRIFPKVKDIGFMCLSPEDVSRDLIMAYTYGDSRFKLTMPGEIVCKFLQEAASEASPTTSEQSLFYQKLQGQIKGTLGIDPVILNLKSIRNSNFMTDVDGKVSMKSYKAFEDIATDLIDTAEARLDFALDKY